MAEEHGRIIVVGGANLDVLGHSFAALVTHDSNPGYVCRSAGGVGRNVAENLARLGLKTVLITALGDDANAEYVAESCRTAGVDLTQAVTVDLPGSLYLAILDDNGDMALAMSDMRALELLTPAVLEQRRETFATAELVVADANLPADTLAWLSTEVTAPILFDPVSTAKAKRAAPLLANMDAVKCNAAEAAALLDLVPRGGALPDPETLAQGLHAAGVRVAFVTDGPRGVFVADEAGVRHHAPPMDPVVDVTGAGDSFTAGVAAAMLLGATPMQAAELGSRMAGLTLSDERTVSEQVTCDVLAEAIESWCL